MKHSFALLTLGMALQLAPPTFASTDNLVPASAAVSERPAQTLRGMIAAVDERNDRISLRLPTDVNEDLKVQDGLVFNSVRFGDQVEVTVESIDGAKTIVGLKKE
jgi:hypothetical protein